MSSDSPDSKRTNDSSLDSTRSRVVPINPKDLATGGGNNNQVARVSVPSVELESSPWNNNADLEAATERRLQLLSRAVVSANNDMPFTVSLDQQTAPDQTAIREKFAGEKTANEEAYLADSKADSKAEPSAATTSAGGQSARVPDRVQPFWEDHDGQQTGHRLDGVADSILEQFPIQQPRVILFAGLESETTLDEVAAEVARLLACRRVGKILLVDANVGTSALSKSAGALDSAGLMEAITGREPWQAHLQTGASSGLEFLPIGQVSDDGLDQNHTERVLESMRSHYQFTCIAVGNFDGGLTPRLASYSDGSFLLVDMSKANKNLAKRAVEQLNATAGRVLGCIALNE